VIDRSSARADRSRWHPAKNWTHDRAWCAAALVLLALTAAACASGPSAARSPRQPRTITDVEGWYTLERGGARVGAEHFVITSSAGRWQLEGHLELSSPVSLTQHYLLVQDVAREEPLGVEVWLELEGVAQHAQGVIERGYLVVDVDTVAGARTVRVPYARGTAVALDTPLASAPVLAALLPELAMGHSSRVRTISLALPYLVPAVSVERYTRATDDGAYARLTIDQEGGRSPPTALWLRADGLPVRARTWSSDGGSPIERHLTLGAPGPAAGLRGSALQRPPRRARPPADDPTRARPSRASGGAAVPSPTPTPEPEPSDPE